MDPRNIQIAGESPNKRFWYREEYPKSVSALGNGVKRILESDGLVPASVCDRGDEAVRQYAEEIVKKDIAKQRLEAVWQDDFAREANFPIMALTDDGMILRGRIISIKGGEMLVHLDEPQKYRGVATYDFRSNGGMPSVLPGEIFGQDMSGFSGKVIKLARKLLIEKYNQQSKCQPQP